MARARRGELDRRDHPHGKKQGRAATAIYFCAFLLPIHLPSRFAGVLGSGKGGSAMSDENRISILICKDAGSVSRTLLAREDLRIRWALTIQEANAVIRWTKCAIAITRPALAKPLIAACRSADREVASIVLLEPSHWSTWREYFDAGATSVLQTTSADQLLDAMSDATGMSFRAAPRIPLKTSVRFGDGTSGNAMNISSTGLCVVDCPSSELGATVRIEFETGGKKFELQAVVSRIFRVGSRPALALAFEEVSPDQQWELDDVIELARKHELQPPETVDDFDPLDDGTVLALRSTSLQGESLPIMRALVSGGQVANSETTAAWLVAACASFSALEVRAIQEPASAPAWAHDAVLARLRVYQARFRAGFDPVPESDVREIFGLCQRLAESVASADEASLVQVTNIRADILRVLYAPEAVPDL
jgi:hypothetical protein